MIRLLGKIPDVVAIGVSGGIDSMVGLDFLTRVPCRHIIAVHVNHGTEHANKAAEFVKDQCEKYNVEFYCNAEHRRVNLFSANREARWREMRYEIFDHFCATRDVPLITMHHLDDCLETWLFSTLNGKAKTIPYERRKVIRPFLLTKRKDIVDYATRHGVEYIDDPSNEDCSYMRNQIRHNIVPEVLKVNPGIHKMISKIVEDRYERIHY